MPLSPLLSLLRRERGVCDDSRDHRHVAHDECNVAERVRGVTKGWPQLVHCVTNPERVPGKTTAGTSNAEWVPGKTAERVHDVGKSAQGVWDGTQGVRDDSLNGLVFRLISGRDERTTSGLVERSYAVGLVCTAGHFVVGGIGVGGLSPTQDQLPERRQR